MSKGLNKNQWLMRTSFHTKMSAAFNRRPCLTRGDTLHVKFLAGGMGSLNVECDVRPSLRRVAAMHEEAVTKAILQDICKNNIE